MRGFIFVISVRRRNSVTGKDIKVVTESDVSIIQFKYRQTVPVYLGTNSWSGKILQLPNMEKLQLVPISKFVSGSLPPSSTPYVDHSYHM